jgi:hypothetical protein
MKAESLNVVTPMNVVIATKVVIPSDRFPSSSPQLDGNASEESAFATMQIEKTPRVPHPKIAPFAILGWGLCTTVEERPLRANARNLLFALPWKSGPLGPRIATKEARALAPLARNR